MKNKFRLFNLIVIFAVILSQSSSLFTHTARAASSSIWPDPITPAMGYDNPSPIEVGLKFRADISGYVTGIRYYKYPGSTGTRIGRLWTMGGAKLAEVTFTSETASGWQSASFSTPAAIQANTTYIISYYVTDGNRKLSITQNFFTDSGVTNGHLYALANGEEGPNGVFSETGGFFNQDHLSSNYWVDLIFDDTPPPPDTTPPVVTSISPADSATDVVISSNLSVSFNEVMDATTIVPTSFELHDFDGNPVTLDIDYNPSTYTAVLDPVSNLVLNTQYTARVTTAVTDIAGNALASEYTWTFTTEAPDVTPPIVTAVKPIDGVAKLRLQTKATVYFNEAMDPASISIDTFELRDPGNNLVLASVTYNATEHSAVLDPTDDLQYGTTYTVLVKGGASGAKDAYNNALTADYSWSFSTIAQRPPVDAAPGGPILIITSSTNLFTRYFVEIIRTEGFNEFDLADIDQVADSTLAGYDIAILGEMALTADQVNMLTEWVTNGGHLIAMRPDKNLAPLLGLEDAYSTLSNAYLLIDTSSDPGSGIIDQTLQFHGTADLYTLNGASSLATLYSNATTATTYPAITVRSVGSSGGQAVAFTFDLARSIVYTHQGNPAWQTGHVNPYQGYGTAVDLFAGIGGEPNWIDFNKINIPQADEQQRFLGNLMLYLNSDEKPLPRFWYFPSGKKAAIILTGDDHWGRATPSGNSMMFFDRHKSQSPVDCSVEDWECVRSSSYGYTGNLMTDEQAAAYIAEGFELGLHGDAGLASGGGWCGTWPADMLARFTAQYDSLFEKYASLPVQSSERAHCYSWFGYTSGPAVLPYASTPEVEENLGIRLDTNISYNPASWATVNPGYQMGSGMLMRFAQVDSNGVMTKFLDIYNAGTQMNDDNGQGATTMRTIVDSFLDAAIGPQGYYGAFVVNMHSDNWYGWSYAGSDQIVASAQERNFPVVSGAQMVEWLDGRNSSYFSDITWVGNTLSFNITPGEGARNLKAMLPAQFGPDPLSVLAHDSNQIGFALETIKGVEYAIFDAAAGSYSATYTPDTFPPVISQLAVDPGLGGIAEITWTTNEASTSRADYGFDPEDLSLNSTAVGLVTQHTIQLSGLLANTTYYYRVTSSDESGNTAIYPEIGNTPASFTTPSAAFIDTTVSDFNAGSTDENTAVTQLDNGEVMLKPDVYEEFNGTTLPAGWDDFIGMPGTTGSVIVSDGTLTVDGANAGTIALFDPEHVVEFIATFTASPNQHGGFGVNHTALSGDAWAIFSTGQSGSQLYARSYTGTPPWDTVSTPIPGDYFGAPHRYRVDWQANQITYSIDGNVVATHNVAIPIQMRPLVSEGGAGGASFSVDQLQMGPFPASGQFTSRVLDSTGSVTDGSIIWDAVVPENTSLALSIRTGNTPLPDDGTWSPFVTVQNGDLIGSGFRYVQYQASFATTDTGVTPVLQEVRIPYNPTSDTLPPQITSRDPAPGALNVYGDADVTVTFSEPMQPSSISSSTFRLREIGSDVDVPADISYSGITASLHPLALLTPGKQYQVTVAGTVADLSGNPLGADDTWTFTVIQMPGPPWMSAAWAYRRSVTIDCPCDQAQSDYQVKIILDNTFDYSKAKLDGSDLRVTTGDGMTPVPFWVESWDPSSQSASFWVKLASIPLEGSSFFLYYGNPAAAATGDASAVFSFFDGFTGTALDTAKWTVTNGSLSQTSVSGGVLTLSATSSFVKINSIPTFGTGYLVEAKAQHPQAGTLNLVAEVGQATDFGNMIRILDNFPDTDHWQWFTNGFNSSMSQTSLNQDWNQYRVGRIAGQAYFQVNEWPESTTINGIPTINLSAFLMSYGEGNTLLVDWLGVRKWCGSNPAAMVGIEEALNAPPTTTDDAFSTLEDSTLIVDAPGVLDNDNDPNGDPLSAVWVSGPDHGTLELNSDGSFSYLPNVNYNGTDSFTYKANDGQLDSNEATVIITVDPVDDMPWMARGWDYRREVAITNPCGQAVTEYQVQVNLDSSFDFSKTLPDGSDLRVTASDGVTPIPFWIETWNPGSNQASIWVKVPDIPLTGTTIYLYYGNPTPSGPIPVETPPIGPWTRATGNPIQPVDGPANGRSLLAENIVYDDVSGHYWMVLANYNTGSVSLIWSDDPADPASWQWHGDVIGSANAPHILYHDSLWYIFYADRGHGGSPYPIAVATSAAIGGPYTYEGAVLTSSEPWEAYRVDEPYVFFREEDSKWVMLYMGDSGSAHEQVSYATADDILGPYTKWGSTPFIPWGSPGSFDAGTIADAWVVKFHDVYYIGYTVSPTTASPWQTAVATTTDWQSINKLGIILPLGPAGAWDANNAFRGAVTQIGDTYVFPYTGDSYQMGIATQPVMMTIPVNDQSAVFPFYDEFNDGIFDTNKWVIDAGSASQLSESGGNLTLSATSSFVKIYGSQSFGMNYLVEAHARHPQAGTLNMIPELGLAGAGFTDLVRLANDFHNTTNWERQAKRSGEPDNWLDMAQTVDTDWHIFRVYRTEPDVAGFQIDANPAETYVSSNDTTVPTNNLPAFLMSYGNGNQFVVDWLRVRKYCGSEAGAEVGREEPRPLSGEITITKSADAQVLSGSTANFEITVSNNGDFALTDVSVSDALAPDCNRSFTDLAIGESQSYTCSLSGVTEDFTNSATATGSTSTGDMVSSAATAFVDVLHPAVSIQIEPESQAIIAGANAVFSVNVTNIGDVILQAMAVTDDQVLDCNRSIGELEAGQSTSYTCSRANVTTGFTHSATVTGAPPLGDAVSATDSATVTVVTLEDAPWLDHAWLYRRPVVISNPCDEATADYQVQILLDSSFDFDKALPDGSDLRVTSLDGVTPIPFWVESWDPVSSQASIWVRMPDLPLSDTAVFLYYGNTSPPGPELVETPPVGPWTKAAGNPILPDSGPANGRSLLAENIVYDDATGHYWMVLANYNNGSVSLVWSDDPANPAAWNWHEDVISSANAPHILQHNGKWYIFFSDWSTPAGSTQHSIQVMESTAITGPYTNRTTILSPDLGSWENWRVDEPYVFQRNDGKWILVYMGDQGDFQNGQYYYEQVGFAYADDLLGPYTKYTGNPILRWGTSGTFDAGTIADPWVVEFHGTYYVGYTVSPTIYSPWQTAVATTTDWENFTKLGVILPLGTSGTWDSSNAFRGAVTRIDDTYVFAYTGDGYQMGIATQPVYISEPLNDPTTIFPFYDDFNDGGFDTSKWLLDSGTTAQIDESDGLLTLTSNGTALDQFIKIYGQAAFGMDYLLEAYASHPQAGTDQLISEVGWMGAGFGGDKVRIADDFHSTTYWERQAALSSTVGDSWVNMNVPVDTSWHTFRVSRMSPNVAGFQIDQEPIETTTSNVPTSNLPAFLMSFGSGNEFTVDWARVRHWCGADAGILVGSEQAWNHPPQANDDSATTDEDIAVTIDVAANDTDVDGNLDPASASAVSGPTDGSLENRGDGTFAYTPNANFNGSDGFDYEVCDTAGLCDQATVSITINPVNDPPVADAGGPYSGDEGSPITLDASGSSDLDDSIALYEWDLDSDGEYDDASGVSTTVTFDDDGSYTVGLRVTDGYGESESDTANVTVTDLSPTAAFNWAPEPQDEGAAVQFSDESTSNPDDIVSWSWNFAGLGTSAEQNPSFTFLDDGSYNVCLTVTDDDNSTDIACHTVTVIDLDPTAAFRWTPEPQDEGSAMQFSDESTSNPDDIVSWSWDFAGLSTSAEQNPSFTFMDDGVYDVCLTVTDEDDSTDTVCHVVTVADLAPAAAFSWSPEPQDEGAAVQFSDESTSNPDDIVSWSWDFAGLGSSALQNPSFTFMDNGSYGVCLTITDEDDSTDTVCHAVTVINVSPVVNVGADASIDEGSLFTQDGFFSDPGADSWTATVEYGEGAGEQSLTLTGKSFNLSNTYEQDGSYSVTVCVSDDDGGSHCDNLTVAVANVAPAVYAGPDNAVIDEGDTYVGSGYFTDPGADSWSATVDYGDGSGAQALALSPEKGFSLSHTYADDGDFSISICVSDDDDTTCVVLDITVENVAPTVAILNAPSSSPEGTPISLTSSVSDPGADSFSYAWNVTKNGSPYASGTAEAFDFTPDDNGAYVVTLEVSDDDGGQGSDSKTISVTNLAPSITSVVNDGPIDEGSNALITVSASDPAGANDPLTYAFDCDGDGVYEIGPLSENTASCSFNDNGVYMVGAIVADDDSGSTLGSTVVTVNNVAPTLTAPVNQSTYEGTLATFDLGSFSDLGIDDDPWSVSVDWGDGSAAISFAMNAQGEIDDQAHTYADNGSYTVMITITDKDGDDGTASFTVTVSNVAPTVEAGADQSANEGTLVSLAPATFNDLGTLDTHTATINWGDGTALESGTITESPFGPPGDPDGMDGTVSGSHVYADNGSYEVEVCVLDDDSAETCDRLTVTVENGAPTVNAGADQTADEGTLVSLAPATFNDLGTLDTHTATIDWGDGSALVSGTVAESPFGPPGDPAGMDGTVSGSHVYADDGSYTVSVCVRDDDNAEACDTLTVTVNNAAPTIEIDLQDQEVQYSDNIQEITITSDDVAADTLVLTNTGLPDDLEVTEVGCTENGLFHTCAWTLSGIAKVPAGTYTITFTVSDDIEASSSADATITVLPEDAVLTFDDNPVAVQVAEPKGNSGLFTLKVLVKEKLPDLPFEQAQPGDIGLAEVEMTLVPVGPGGSIGPVLCARESVSGTGYDAIATYACDFDNIEVNTYTVEAVVVGGYYISTNQEDVLVVYDPSLGFATGGGWFYWPGTENPATGYPGDKTNFGFNMKYNRRGTNVQGSLLIIRHLVDGTIYRMKSNALYGLALGEDQTIPLGWAAFSGKGTYQEPGWLEPIGNYEFTAYVEDHNEPGTGVDLFWIEVLDKDRTPEPELSLPRPATGNTVPISGGNLVVPHRAR